MKHKDIGLSAFSLFIMLIRSRNGSGPAMRWAENIEIVHAASLREPRKASCVFDIPPTKRNNKSTAAENRRRALILDANSRLI
jgi:hypothetical protein